MLLSSLLHAADGMHLLNRAVAASQRLNYSGTFVYQHGGVTETTRITHFVDAGREYEHLEVLDGSPREVVREGDEVKCYLPESRTVFIEKRSERGTFPALLPATLGSIAEHYQVKLGAHGRVAGLDTQIIVLEPRDEFRYGHQFWVDTASGLLLKAALINERHEVVESFAFTDLKIGGPPNHERMRLRIKTSEDWKVRHGNTREGRAEEGQWSFKQLPPGFTRTSGMRRQVRTNQPEGMHYVFSDGLASISAFIEPLPERGAKGETGKVSMGAINAYRRVLNEHQIMVMGEVPPAAVRKLAEGIEARRRH